MPLPLFFSLVKMLNFLKKRPLEFIKFESISQDLAYSTIIVHYLQCFPNPHRNYLEIDSLFHLFSLFVVKLFE